MATPVGRASPSRGAAGRRREAEARASAVAGGRSSSETQSQRARGRRARPALRRNRRPLRPTTRPRTVRPPAGRSARGGSRSSRAWSACAQTRAPARRASRRPWCGSSAFSGSSGRDPSCVGSASPWAHREQARPLTSAAREAVSQCSGQARRPMPRCDRTWLRRPPRRSESRRGLEGRPCPLVRERAAVPRPEQRQEPPVPCSALRRQRLRGLLLDDGSRVSPLSRCSTGPDVWLVHAPRPRRRKLRKPSESFITHVREVA